MLSTKGHVKWKIGSTRAMLSTSTTENALLDVRLERMVELPRFVIHEGYHIIDAYSLPLLFLSPLQPSYAYHFLHSHNNTHRENRIAKQRSHIVLGVSLSFLYFQQLSDLNRNPQLPITISRSRSRFSTPLLHSSFLNSSTHSNYRVRRFWIPFFRSSLSCSSSDSNFPLIRV
ncbi:hypothetical protein VNO77_05718 [Canavalia gladiata]|uniref:Uncharacterized protein n=1 Tax=Canavalia gladiata TaxID=3824 RepID=A0AAN9MZL8_CANGL